MSELLLHPTTQAAIERFVARPSHAVLLVAPPGAGKATMARYLAAKLLDIDAEALDKHPHFKQLTPKDGKAISIDSVREIARFLALKTTGKHTVARVVIIESAQFLTTQAQNALLKTIEEPPADTVLILAAPSEQN